MPEQQDCPNYKSSFQIPGPLKTCGSCREYNQNCQLLMAVKRRGVPYQPNLSNHEDHSTRTRHNSQK